ncbi:MAG: SCO family protein [Acidobacteriota bacterium]
MESARLLPVSLRALLVSATCAALTAGLPLAGQEHRQNHHHRESATGPVEGAFLPLELPNVELVDQHGETVRLPALAAGRKVAINFIFTSCTTVCSPMGALFATLQRQLEARPDAAEEVAFVSITIDPAVDTPQRLKTWSERFDGSSRWRLLTASKPVVDGLLKDLGVFSALKEDHAPLILLGDTRSNRWLRAHGLAPPHELIRLLDELPPAATRPAQAAANAQHPLGNQPAREYFTDTRLVDQHGQEHRFYSDLIAGRTVVINPFFSTCTGSCPVMHGALQRLHEALDERLGRDVFLLSISVDPEHDTPERLNTYAEAFEAGPGWSFLTGEPADVERVLARLGQAVPRKEAHQAIFLVGNDRTGLWQRAFGLGPAEGLLEVVRSVADDSPPDAVVSPLTQPSTSR